MIATVKHPHIVPLFRGFSGGTLPGLSARDKSIPPALIAEAVADGSLKTGEVLRYAVVPGDQPWSEGLLLTDSVIARFPERTSAP